MRRRIFEEDRKSVANLIPTSYLDGFIKKITETRSAMIYFIHHLKMVIRLRGRRPRNLGGVPGLGGGLKNLKKI
jgi:hypothetical protein